MSDLNFQVVRLLHLCLSESEIPGRVEEQPQLGQAGLQASDAQPGGAQAGIQHILNLGQGRLCSL